MRRHESVLRNALSQSVVEAEGNLIRGVWGLV
jgi:hypothetical protein